MDFLITIFNETLYRPLFSLLVWVYNTIPGHDLGIAIILVTIFLRIVLYPLSHKALKSQKALQELQPKIKEIQKKFKDKQEQAKATMEFYKENKINPFSGCLPLLIQLPILIGLYRVFSHGPQPGESGGALPLYTKSRGTQPNVCGVTRSFIAKPPPCDSCGPFPVSSV